MKNVKPEYPKIHWYTVKGQECDENGNILKPIRFMDDFNICEFIVLLAIIILGWIGVFQNITC